MSIAAEMEAASSASGSGCEPSKALRRPLRLWIRRSDGLEVSGGFAVDGASSVAGLGMGDAVDDDFVCRWLEDLEDLGCVGGLGADGAGSGNAYSQSRSSSVCMVASGAGDDKYSFSS